MDNQTEQWEFHSNSEAQTETLAAALAHLAVPGSLITLDGDLGAGKTAFSKAFAKHLGVPGIVNSPTFTLIKEYEGRLPLYHMDVYRISQDEAEGLGLDEYFFGTGVSLVEWASIIPDLLPPQRLELKIETLGPEQRIIRLIGYGEPYLQWCRSLAENGV
ncbi:tRNA (adenosine(37)-N6)-threonylcarbamoyltransferase complex ATPase subunit type 1 TsaE [Paenibacillus sp. JX-17]|uniref:tRNA threonylcarbamoyladenosine biosynthesis protein TsaE n=1 Tax=Paenibacillus lacisoli TaxID=3064525 RepID=A0ABT9CD83_9BACL|nr:tRNA (adenosine(37)-N6)-threonylcarbamoyltransferase complex ATPase subunit type 1 TsaE [Paenibacillus sp. JX-17]MDO7907230.1 tRNA (adenosine(37)-N6)-threonylcarbamoyltransferase complex ATPase subunit type 1 TsaE [Paenibacillus sp. JX-17]